MKSLETRLLDWLEENVKERTEIDRLSASVELLEQVADLLEMEIDMKGGDAT